MKKEETVKSKKAIVGATIAILLMLIGVTYAAFVYQKEGLKESEIRTGTLMLELDDDTSNGIIIEPAIPISDTDTGALASLNSYKFTLRNTGSANAQYRISLVDDEGEYTKDGCSNKKLPHRFLKVGLEKNGSAIAPFALENSDVIDEGTISSNGGEIEYTMKIWIDYRADTAINGTHFHGKLKLEAIVAGRSNYETGE